MKRCLYIVALLLLIGVPARAQEPQAYPKSWSVELGTGYMPLYMGFIPGESKQKILSDKGQEIGERDEYAPMVTLSGVLRVNRRSEFTATAQLNWRGYSLVQYPSFGTDPAGNPRYDIGKKPEPAGRAVAFAPAFTLRYRFLYTPDKTVTLYSGVGIGLTLGYSDRPVAVFPDLTLLGVRSGGEHLYFFAELTLGNVATLAHGGLGWKF